jgi:hypothetical protein
MAAAGPPADLADALAAPLSITAIGELLGIPLDERRQLRRWADTARRSRQPRPRPASRPRRFDPARRPNPHLAFGHGSTTALVPHWPDSRSGSPSAHSRWRSPGSDPATPSGTSRGSTASSTPDRPQSGSPGRSPSPCPGSERRRSPPCAFAFVPGWPADSEVAPLLLLPLDRLEEGLEVALAEAE